MCKTCGCPSSGNEQLEMRIDGIVNEGCIEQVKVLLMGLPGVLHVEYLAAQSTWLVDFNPRHTTEEMMRQEVSNLGYKIVDAAIKPSQHHHGRFEFLKRIFR
jgi:cation transport ATPase